MKEIKIKTGLPKIKYLIENLALQAKVLHSYTCARDGVWECSVKLESALEVERYIECLSINVEYADIKDVVYQAMITI